MSHPVEAQLLAAMRKYWGYDSFRPLQARAMAAAMTDRDSVVVLPTGGGKSLCFQTPAVCRPGLTLVVSPLISLMKDQVDALRACGVPAATVNSTLTYAERKQVADQIQRGELKLLYAAPERLLASRTLEFLKGAQLAMIAVDEAHCISAWGHDFRPEYRGLRALKHAFPGVGVHAYTATATETVQRDIAEQLGLVDPQFLVGSFDRPNLVYRVRRAANRFNQVCELVRQRRGESGIVYCISRKEVDKTAAALTALGYRALPYHAGLTDEERHRNQDAFLQERVDVVVATVAFGMGIDKSNVRYVIHAGMPKSIEHYVQESGRAGRDGLEADCLLLHSGRDATVWKMLIERGDPDAAAGGLEALQAMADFCGSAACRHQALVEHFGQAFERPNCGACDVCLGELDLVDQPLVLAQKILSCVVRLGERFGGDYTAKVLVGSQEQRILEAGHDKLSTHGLLADAPHTAIRAWIDQLVGQGFLAKTGEYNTLSLTDAGRGVLRGEGAPQLLEPAKRERRTRLRGGADGAEDPWEGVDRDLFEQLRALRTRLAAERGVPPYVVFGDAALRDMARRRPSSPDTFLQVRGVGQRKCDEYGAPFLECILRYCTAGALPMDLEATPDSSGPGADGSDAASRDLADAPGTSLSALAAFEHFRRGASIEDVMQQLGRARSTVTGYLGEYLRHEQVTSPEPWLDRDTSARIEAAIEEVGSYRLKPIFEKLEGQVPYDAIRIMAACLANRNAAS
ncbi:MAG TPA: DNA helicase RecQ [Lacipirellulaceae bacterium]|nr:DNA helicase RecQ [Lacipirellulaceae bacterium]